VDAPGLLFFAILNRFVSCNGRSQFDLDSGDRNAIRSKNGLTRPLLAVRFRKLKGHPTPQQRFRHRTAMSGSSTTIAKKVPTFKRKRFSNP
jgi:hypothetical protein